MRPGRGSWLIILLIAAIASSVIFMLAPGRQPLPQTKPRSEQGYYVRDSTLTGTGADGRILYRSADVLVTSRATAATNRGQSPLTIRTDYLELDPDTYIATTNRRVVMERSRDTLHARGMRVYLKQDRLQLDAEVRGIFLP